MDELREKQKVEALERMRSLKLPEHIISAFEKEGRVAESTPASFLTWPDEATERRIRSFEDEYGALVYHVVRTHTVFGELEAYLCVSKYIKEWQMDREDIPDGQSLAYVNNITDPVLSEWGSIGIQQMEGGGLLRTW